VDDVTRRWTLRLVAGLAAGAVVLSGCSERQEAADTLPGADAEPSATEAELPPLGPPEFPVPVAAREKTPEGALAFAEYYISLGSEVGVGSIPAATFLDLSAGCALCREIAAYFEEDQAAGYTYQDFSYTFEEYGAPQLSGDTAELGFVYTQSDYTVVDRSGREVADRAGEATGDLQSGMLLEWQSAQSCWRVTSLTIG
jgi:hypothetical protein